MMKKVALLVVAWFAARGLDKLLGKWLATWSIAFQEKSSKDAMTEFNSHLDAWRKTLPEKSKEWEKWREES